MVAEARARLHKRRPDVGHGSGSGEDRRGTPLSYWHDSLGSGDALEQRPLLPGDVDADVALVGDHACPRRR